jgi:hypothetical protein
MGCVRLAASMTLIIFGLTVSAVGIAGCSQSPEAFPIGAGLTMIVGVVIAAIGYSISPAAQRDEE